LPIAHARFAEDGGALFVHAAPISKAAPLTLRVRYEAEAPMHAGTVRFTLPARGMDPRAAQTEIALHAGELLDARIAGQLVHYKRAKEPDVLVSEPWTALPITAHARAGAPLRADLQSMRCDGEPCVRARAWAGPRELAPRDIILALDASPSTEGPARGRLLAAIAAVLDAAPSGSRVRALAFAARAEPIVATPIEPGLVALAPFGAHVGSEGLGAATRFDAAWQLAEQWLAKRERGSSKLRPLLVIVGDGGLSVRAEHAGAAARSAQRTFAKAKRLGVEVSALNVADREAVAELRSGVQHTGGVTVNAGSAAELAARGAEREPLHEQVVALFAPTVSKGLAGTDLGLLRAGEALSFMGPSRARGGRSGYAVHASGALIAVDAQDRKGADQLARAWPVQPKHIHKKTRCDRRGPANARSGINSDAAPVALAEERVCLMTKASAAQQAAKPVLGKGMPSDPLLDMLRLRVMPFARDCFRRDRAGKSNYQLRAVFVFALAEREVVSAGVEGQIPEPLRQCLMGAVDTLDVPRFTGTVEVRYPLVTESVPKAEQIQLTQVAAQAIDSVIGED
jgi:Mg-chelatase subunit ChlD